MTDPYPQPPHLIGGMVVKGMSADDALGRLAAVIRSLSGRCGCATQPTVADALLAPDGGPLLLEVPFSDSPEGYTGVQFVLSGELVGMPESVELEPNELAIENRIRSCVRATFEAACRELDPLYGGVDFEWRLPAPIDLSSDHARLPSDLYVSESVTGTDPGLLPALSELYGVDSIPLASGTLLPGGGVIDSSYPVTADPVNAGRTAASRLGQSL